MIKRRACKVFQVLLRGRDLQRLEAQYWRVSGRKESAVHIEAAAAANARGRTPEPVGRGGSEPRAHKAELFKDGFGLPGLRRIPRQKPEKMAKSQKSYLAELRVIRTYCHKWSSLKLARAD